ncbi:MAG: helix-hairpin-helix domain-containing protein [Nitrospiraceae bacterium]|nr:MAG: helix-hairpin-helix domain-containing protein [Nitrospiraceae bacterium]
MRKEIMYRLSRLAVAALILTFFAGSIAFAGSADGSGKININEATVKELSGLPGIGKKKAEAIVAYRNEKGKFASVEDLRKVEGIGAKLLDRVRDHVTAGGS